MGEGTRNWRREDGKALIWKVNANGFSGWGAEGWEPEDFDPVLRIDATPRRVGQIVWHPTANHVLATSTSEHTSLVFNPTGTLLVTTSRDRKVRLFDPRTGGEAVRIAEGHSGVKSAQVVWLATTGFSKMSNRQVSLWEAGSLNNIKTTTIDQSSGLRPMAIFGTTNTNTMFSTRSPNTSPPTGPQRGMCFLPHRALSVSDCEIARAYKTCGLTVEPIAFIVPRKSDSFQSDTYPPAPSSEPALTAGEFFSGKTAPPKLVSLKDGAVFAGQAPGPPSPLHQLPPCPPPLALPLLQHQRHHPPPYYLRRPSILFPPRWRSQLSHPSLSRGLLPLHSRQGGWCATERKHEAEWGVEGGEGEDTKFGVGCGDVQGECSKGGGVVGCVRRRRVVEIWMILYLTMCEKSYAATRSTTYVNVHVITRTTTVVVVERALKSKKRRALTTSAPNTIASDTLTPTGAALLVELSLLFVLFDDGAPELLVFVPVPSNSPTTTTAAPPRHFTPA
ncbi:hypothetical protein BDY19DRAFT_909150 [Irpex rosettiformis]|uniref:Uncharacterized protein n=1 Tax=Irpex rosettiformis TaxID=378272 RepID=A0ACB8TTJ5_9APHY|nr:hypothetical protein BDY19DRAFT_909150 [Irpex rosettiformis]